MTAENIVIFLLAFLVVQGFVFLLKTLKLVSTTGRKAPDNFQLPPPVQMPIPEHRVIAVSDKWTPELPMLDLCHKRKFNLGGK